MTAIDQRVEAFKRKAVSGPVQVNLYGDKPYALKKLVLYASLLAGGAAIMTSLSSPEQNQSLTTKNREFSGKVTQIEALPQEQADEVEIRFVSVTYRGKEVQVMDEASRIRLTKKTAQDQNLETVGLTWKDLYAVIHAETAWIPRDGMGRNGVVSVGLAQMEPNTAKSLGIKDARDPAAAISGAAALMKEAAQWSKQKISGIRLNGHQRQLKIREGISIYYNLSTRGRAQWNGHNTQSLPMETQAHIRNTTDGRKLAEALEKKFKQEQRDAAPSTTIRSGNTLQSSALSQRAAALALAMTRGSKEAITLIIDGKQATYLPVDEAVNIAKEATQQAQLQTGWQNFYFALHESTGLDANQIKAAAPESSDVRDAVFALAGEHKEAEDFVVRKGGKTDRDFAEGMSQYIKGTIASSAAWTPGQALAGVHMQTIRYVANLSKAIDMAGADNATVAMHSEDDWAYAQPIPGQTG